MEAATATAVLHPRGAEMAAETRMAERAVAWLFVGTGIALFAVMGLAGLTMRLTQADVIELSPSWFYRLMTLHGAGMLAGALLAMMGALWFVLRPTISLRLDRMLASYAAIVAGALAVLVATLVGGFATGWTFLTPLPYSSAGAWRTWATIVFLAGLLLVGVGFLVYCVDVFGQATSVYGGLERALGIAYLRGRDDDPPPPQALAAVVVALEGLIASAVGTTIVVALLGRGIDSGVELDALWAKNLTYFFGHSVANLILYLGAGVLYVLVPRYAGRPWKTTKPIVVAWLFTLLFVATAYSHHLYMDFVQPEWAQAISSTASFGAALPAAVVTIYTGMMLVWGSQYRWTLASSLLYLGFAGWAIGGTGAVIDSVIPINFRFHNTLWVPAHFHTYLLMGVIFWAFALFAHLLERAAGRPASRGRTVVAIGAMLVGGYGLVGAWYISGALGVPRRYAVQPPGTDGYSLAGAIFVLVFSLGFLVLLWEFATLARAARERRYLLVERVAAWTGGRYLARERAPEEPEPERPEPATRAESLLASRRQLGFVAALAVAAIASFLPPVADEASESTRWHHLLHGGEFLFGVAVGLALASLPAVVRRVAALRELSLAAVIAAPAGMLLAMLPAVYDSVEPRPFLHFLYHLGLAALGLVAGTASAGLGRVTGRLLVVLSIGMALMYAAGVQG